ncbi:MAG: helix-turn-helix transcriptional regulator [Bacteroidota bacterium]
MKTPQTFEELLNQKYGKPGSETRESFETESRSFMIGELIKEERKRAKLTQEELAEKVGTKKSYISRLENGKIDIQLSTFFRIIEEGLGKRVNISFT